MNIFLKTNEEISKSKEKSNLFRVRSDMKPYSHTIMVSGSGYNNHLGAKPNQNYIGRPHQKLSIDPSSLSFSVYCKHSVQATRSSKLLPIGNNYNSQMCETLPK
ncbi:hypothetical protein M9Y10_034709 [Tritrichomonas musculus]|uniref:Uncharacterized protein n=1 Tax=Tritrichomonas musculus TaxID=1915356 RepID=A0ABR2KGM3_9EUKA